ncbi:MAG: type VI secretion system Vgr family protein [Candidatus Binataceae bacterium]
MAHEQEAFGTDQRLRFEFRCKQLPAAMFGVVEMRGWETLSGLYRFEIQLVAEASDLNFDVIIDQPGTFKIIGGGDGDAQAVYSGIVTSIKMSQQINKYTYYEAMLEPSLSRLARYRYSDVHLNKSIQDIISTVFDACELRAGQDYEFRLIGQSQTYPYTCQFEESCLDFVNRLMEREGLYYYLEPGEGADKLIITDDKMKHSDSRLSLNYRPSSEPGVRGEPDAVQTVTYERTPLPNKVVVKNYNYEKASSGTISADSVVSRTGVGEIAMYGEHVSDREQAQRIADVRGQELLCRGKTFTFESTAVGIRPGLAVRLARHFRRDFNTDYMPTAVTHEGSQAAAFLAGIEAARPGRERGVFYRCEAEMIPANVQYRAARRTPQPRIDGTLSAFVASDTSGEYADLDKEGRYLARLPFTRQSGTDGSGKDKKTNRIRFATPFSGQDSGMYLPLRKDTEVMLSFAGGDPDRPIITAAAANSDKPSLVTQDNETRNVLRTGSGNLIEMEDKLNNQQIRLLAPLQNTAISIGSPVGVLDNLLGLVAAVAATSSSSGKNGGSTATTNGNESSKSPPPANLQLYTEGTTLHHSGNYTRIEVGKKAKTGDYKETATPGDGDLVAVLVGDQKDGANPGSLVLVTGKDEVHKILNGYSLTTVCRTDVGAPAKGEYKVAAANDISLDTPKNINMTCYKQNVTILNDQKITNLGTTNSIRTGATSDIFMGNQFNMTIGALERIFVGTRISLFLAAKVDFHPATKTEFNIGKAEMTIGYNAKIVNGADIASTTLNIRNAPAAVRTFASNVGTAIVEAMAASAEMNNVGMYAGMGGLWMYA